jgi:MATE family multidrug resistance protein
VVTAAVQLLALMALSLPADAGQTVLSAALRARGDIWFPTAIYAGAYLLVMIVGGWALAFPAGLGVRGLVVATLIGCVCGASGLGARWAWLARQDAHEIRSCD